MASDSVGRGSAGTWGDLDFGPDEKVDVVIFPPRGDKVIGYRCREENNSRPPFESPPLTPSLEP